MLLTQQSAIMHNMKHKKSVKYLFLSEETYQVLDIFAGPQMHTNQILCLQSFKLQRCDYQYQP